MQSKSSTLNYKVFLGKSYNTVRNIQVQDFAIESRCRSIGASKIKLLLKLLS